MPGSRKGVRRRSVRPAASKPIRRSRAAATFARATSSSSSSSSNSSEYRQLYDVAPIIWMVLSPAAIILDISATGGDALKASAQFIIGTPLRMWLDAESRPMLADHMRRAAATHGRVDSELRLRSRDGQMMTVQLYSRRSTFQRRYVFPSVAVDITEKRQLEFDRAVAELQRDRAAADQKLARASEQAKDRLIATVSHELRNPLSPALIAATALAGLSELPDRARRMATVIRRNIELEARLIDDLLDVARATRGQLDLRLQRVDVHDIIRHAMNVCASAAAAKEITLVEDCRATRRFAHADPARIEQVFWNLINNAVKFSPRRGQVIVRTTSDDAGVLTATVRDFGSGMDAATLNNLFSPFEQPRAPAGGTAGLGLGLTIARSIVEQHGGQIWATSDGPGTGATFEVELMTLTDERAFAPPPETMAPTAVPERAGATSVGQGSVLIVEDHADTAEMLAAALRQRGFQVKVAKSIAEALPELGRTWDVVVSDIGLGDGSGLEIARQARATGAHPARLIALSGFGTDRDKQASRAAGFDTHLVKPIDVDELLSVLK